MKRQECEYLIRCLLEDIRNVVRMYDPDIDGVSLYVSHRLLSAFARDDSEEKNYLLKFDFFQEVENDDSIA